MNKKILFAAIGSALAASPMIAAQADVKVGGHAQVEYYNYKLTTGTSSSDKTSSGLIDNARGRFWIDASEDLGGMKAMARYEFSVDTANSGASAANGNGALGYDGTARSFDQRTREKYVGLSGGFGTVTAGNLHGVYKRLGGVRWDPVNATVLEARGNGGQSGGRDASATHAHNGFIPGAVKWESGMVTGPVNVEVMFAPNKNSTGGSDTSDGNDYQLGVSFKPMPGLEVIAATVKNKKQPSVAANSDQNLTKFGARYQMGPHTFWGQIEDVDTNPNLDIFTSSTVPTSAGVTSTTKAELGYRLFGYSLKAGNNLFVAQYGSGTFEVSGSPDTDITYLSLAILHSLSKNTTAHVGYRTSSYEETGQPDTKEKVFAAGLRVNF